MRPSKGNVLIVDDNPANLRLLSQILSERGYKVRAVLSGTRALAAVQSTPPDLILLDVMMPEMTGYEVCEKLKANLNTQGIPIIFISALGETEEKVKAFTMGGVDYITKPFKVPEVLARVATHLSLREARRRLEEEIIQRDKLIAELDAYAETVTHDLKNPLGLLKGYADLLLLDYETISESELKQCALGISHGVNKMSKIIDALLLLADTRKKVEFTALDMAPITAEALQRFAKEIETSHVAIIVPERWPMAIGYAPWVEEVWVNYIGNALKYGRRPDKNTLLRVELGYDEFESIPISTEESLASVDDMLANADVLPHTPENLYLRFWVRDNGEGLMPVEQSRLFTPFERLHKIDVTGQGLGLSIVKRIVERLGGWVGVESVVGQGSTFFFALPKA
ncbi:MAG: response regulator [Anaerolineae bacterium]|nr:response regulator [Anaerolineae bacterium]